MKNRMVVAAILLLIALIPSFANGDAASDLAEGRVALQNAKLNDALPLLTSAAQALPNSVEAHIALAECLIRLGEIDRALIEYRQVAKLSPQHEFANEMIKTLTARHTNSEKQFATAKTFAQLGEFNKSIEILHSVYHSFSDSEKRDDIRLLVAEYRLWAGQNDQAATEAMLVAQQSEEPALTATARAIAAVALASVPAKAKRILAGVNIPVAWANRVKLIDTFELLEDSNQAVAAAKSLIGALADVPQSPFRTALQVHVLRIQLSNIELAVSRNEIQRALEIAWPMLSNKALPQADAFLKPIALEGGWVENDRVTRQSIAKSLLEIGQRFAFAQTDVNEDSLLPLWITSEVYRQISNDQNTVNDRLNIASLLEQLSRPAENRKRNDPLSPADAMQFSLLHDVADQLNIAQIDTLVTIVLSQVSRYRAADDWKNGLSKFVAIDLKADPPQAKLVGNFANLRHGLQRINLSHGLASNYVSLGDQLRANSRNSVLATPLDAVNPADITALALFRQSADFPQREKESREAAHRIVDQYASASQWKLAEECLDIYYATQRGDDLAWKKIQLTTQQIAARENDLLSARRGIGDALAPTIENVLSQIDTLLAARPTKQNREVAISIVDGLTSRYAQLARHDLVDQVITTQLTGVADNAKVKQLDDWALWMKAHFIGQRANLALSDSVIRAEDVGKLPIDALHTAELDLLNQLVTKHPSSDFADDSVNAILRIAATYENNRAFNAARLVLTNFLKAQPKLNQTIDFEYHVVAIRLREAKQSFAQRKDAAKTPEEILPQHVEAIQALGVFLKKHPTGDYSPIAMNELFAIARQYGEAGAWPVTREIIKQFAVLVPDFRSPNHLKFLEAATYLGELDQQRGIQLLVAPPAVQAAASIRNGRNESAGNGAAAGPATPGEEKLGEEKLGDSAKKEPTNATSSNTPFDDFVEGVSQVAPRAKPESPAAALPGGGAGGGFGPGENGFYQATNNESSLARIRQTEQRQYYRIALLEGELNDQLPRRGGRQAQLVGKQQSGMVLPTGILLTEAEMKRQGDAADAAYLILIQLVKARTPDKTATADVAKSQILWMFDFFEGQLRADQTIVLIKRYLTDHTTATDRIALAYRVLTDSIIWARQNQINGTIDHTWLAKRHEVFESARREIATFIEQHSDEKRWRHAAQFLAIDSYRHEAALVGMLSRERAAGLLVQSVQALLSLPDDAPDHPQLASLADRIFAIAGQIQALGQNEQAIYVLRQITLNYPAHARANQALLQIAQLYATGMQNPLRAVETYQEYLSRTDGDPSVPTQIFAIAKALSDQKRYLESLHVYGVFVDSFPTHAQAASALHAIGKTHQANGVWEDAIDTYERIIEEYSGNAAIPQVKLDIAECQINLGEWFSARKQYEEYLEEFPKDGQVATAQSRLEVLKKLDRFQDLLADDQIDRNKDDAQFQIGRTVLIELSNPVKAVEEFRKVIANFGDSDVADDAQMEIGRTLLSLGRLDEGREELLKVPANHPNSPLSDDALFLIGQSFEQDAVRLAEVTQDSVRAESHVMEQLHAYARFNKQIQLESRRSAEVRGQLKAKGDKQQLALNEAVDASRLGNLFNGQLYCEVTQAELETEAETALQIANRQDRINDAYREAVVIYMQAATNYPLGDKTDQSLLRIAQIFETRLKDKHSAMQTYQKVVKLFPGTPVAEDAAWKVTQFHVEEGKYALAAEAYKNFIRNYPASQRVADAQFGLAEVMEQLGRWVDAMDAYEVFQQKFAKHPKVKLATQQIGWIKTYRK